MRKFCVLLAVFCLGAVWAQEDESAGSNNDLPPGVSITINDPNAGLEFEVAEELYLSPTYLETEMRPGETTASLAVSIASRVNTEVEVRTNNSDLMVSGDTFVRIRAGSRVGVSFTAFSAHSGTVDFVNTQGEVVESIGYEVTEARSYTQRVSASAKSNGNTSARYGISFDDGYGFNINVSRSEDGDISGGVTGSYSW